MDSTADYEILMLEENNTLSETDDEGIRDPATTLSILIIGTFLALLIFLSIAGNILVCVAIYTDRGLRRIGNLFLASLAIADLFVASLVMTFAGVNDLLGYWVFGAQFCDTWVAFDVMCSTASILNLCAISLDRYIHIKDPLSLLLPGGEALFTTKHGYVSAGKILFPLALENNVPIWGTCLGMELLSDIVCDSSVLVPCNATNIALPLTISPGYTNSTLLGKAPTQIINILKTQNVTANFHSLCVTKKSLFDAKCLHKWKILAANRDLDGKRFISLAEIDELGVFMAQFHPEKNIFEWNDSETTNSIPHDPNAVLVSQYFSQVFLHQVRTNQNRFPTSSEENNALIYNFNPEYTGANGAYFEQVYYFDMDTME